jgi:universal stress protein E
MRSIERILVYTPPVQDSIALQRAEQIAAKLNAHLDVLVISAHLDQSEFLEQEIRVLRSRGIRAHGEQVWVDEKHASKDILLAARRLGSDLLVKQHQKQHQANSWLKKLLLPDDWHLSRDTPVPLLLVQGRRPWAKGKVLAAMDVEHRDASHLALQSNVIVYASKLCELFGACVHVVSAFAPSSQSQIPDFVQFDRAVAGHLGVNPNSSGTGQTNGNGSNFRPSSGNAQHCHDLCRWFQDDYEISERQLHLVEGPARQVIPNVTSQLDAALVVLGTVARHGVLGSLVGNTVEAVLDEVECDVLVLHAHMDRAPRPAWMEQRAMHH